MSTLLSCKFPGLLLLALLCTGVLYAQPDLPAASWRKDLRFLQKTVHEDYSFLFRKTTSEAFDREVEKLYAAIPDLESHETIVGLARLVASFEYGHTSLRLGGKTVNFHQLPLNLTASWKRVYPGPGGKTNHNGRMINGRLRI